MFFIVELDKADSDQKTSVFVPVSQMGIIMWLPCLINVLNWIDDVLIKFYTVYESGH